VISGVVATVAIFLPSFVFICLLGPILPRLRKSRRARGALDGMNAAVVSLIAVVTVWFSGSALLRSGGVNPLAAGVFGISLIILLATKLNPTWLILASGVVGVAAHALH
jgi:chromate transporter